MHAKIVYNPLLLNHFYRTTSHLYDQSYLFHNKHFIIPYNSSDFYNCALQNISCRDTKYILSNQPMNQIWDLFEHKYLNPVNQEAK